MTSPGGRFYLETLFCSILYPFINEPSELFCSFPIQMLDTVIAHGEITPETSVVVCGVALDITIFIQIAGGESIHLEFVSMVNQYWQARHQLACFISKQEK